MASMTVEQFIQGRLRDVGIWPDDAWPDEFGFYEWAEGAETLDYPTFHFRGQYHPNDALCEPRPFTPLDEMPSEPYLCHWCGRVVW